MKTLATLAMAAALVARTGYAADAPQAPSVDPTLTTLHQYCVIGTFSQSVKSAREFDPGLLDRAVAQCETLLLPFKNGVLSATHDTALSDRLLAPVRRASRRAVAVALLGYFERADPAGPSPR